MSRSPLYITKSLGKANCAGGLLVISHCKPQTCASDLKTVFLFPPLSLPSTPTNQYHPLQNQSTSGSISHPFLCLFPNSLLVLLSYTQNSTELKPPAPRCFSFPSTFLFALAPWVEASAHFVSCSAAYTIILWPSYGKGSDRNCQAP